MRFRDLFDQQGTSDEHDDSAGGELDDLRRAGEDFLAAGDEAIQKALSSDSEAFLHANQQSGGE
jgi:alpha-D-ribose 1-methylphosphonate 5-triphosphate synthase subunit PhnI